MSHALRPMRPMPLPPESTPILTPARAPQAIADDSRGECMSCRGDFPLRLIHLGLCPPCESRLDQ